MTNRIVPLKIENNQEILIEVAEETAKNGVQHVSVLDKAGAQIEAIETTIQNFSHVILRSVNKLAQDSYHPEKISLGFAIKFVGEAAIPAIAKGSAEAGLTVNIEWSIRDRGTQNHEC